MLNPFTKKIKRIPIESSKFYFWHTSCGKEVDLIIGETEWELLLNKKSAKSETSFCISTGKQIGQIGHS